jgi:hypothetical protein
MRTCGGGDPHRPIQERFTILRSTRIDRRFGCAQDRIMAGTIRNRSGRLIAPILALAALLMLPLGMSARAQDALILVKLDIAKLVQLPEKVQTVILGNPIIADVTLLKGGTSVVLTGKSYGDTNLILLDRSGNVISDRTIRVVQEEAPLLIVQRGMERESWTCKPRCQPTVELGDSAGYSNGWASAVQARNGFATPGGPSQPAGGAH